MNTLMVLLLAVAIVAAAIYATRAAGSDGGPRHDPPRRAEDEWSPTLPTHPYAR